MGYVFTYPQKQVLSLSNASNIQLALAPEYINRKWRADYRGQYLFRNDPVIEMRFESQTAHFPELHRLGRQICRMASHQRGPQGEGYIRWPKEMQHRVSEVTIILELEAQHGISTTLADVRFNATRLIEATLYWRNETTTIRVVKKGHQQHEALGPTATSTIPNLRKLRRNILQAWP